uniref:Cut-like homeobox 1b n=1 Tax=Cyprinus carpio TaxID=7962 RepID=A0A8C2PZC5_CYPCA
MALSVLCVCVNQDESPELAKEHEMLPLVEDVQRLQASLSTLRESSAAQIRQLQQQLKSQTNTLQVHSLSPAAPTSLSNSARQSWSPGEFSKGTQKDSSKALEVLLLEKNRGLQSESASLRIANTELSSESNASLQLEFSAAVKTSAEQKELILRLEQDLSTIQTMSRPDAEVRREHDLAIVPEPIKEATALFSGVGGSPQTDLPQGQMDSLLSIISSQRERYQVSAELPKQSKSCHGDVCVCVCVCKAGDSDDTVMRYSSQYEERLDPFTSFSKKERLRRYQSSVWCVTWSVSGSCDPLQQTARTVAFFYKLMLHCLVFLVLYKAAWSESIGRDCAAFCAKKYSDHLLRFHENGDELQ